MTNFEIVQKIIGKINPVGDSGVDAERFNNLKEMCSLHQQISEAIWIVSGERNRYEHSMKIAGQFAYNHLKELISETEL